MACEPDINVVLRLQGTFDPLEVTQRLGLLPNDANQAGDLKFPGRSEKRYEHSNWSIWSDTSVDADYLEPHLTWLLDQLEPRAAALQEILDEGADCALDCGWSSTGMGGGPFITPDSMTRLGALGLPLLISFYHCDDRGEWLWARTWRMKIRVWMIETKHRWRRFRRG